jgi:hypothetical protein
VISATCHCGAVQIEIPSRPETATSCNCSICRRLGALWAFFPVNAVRITVQPGATDEYMWGGKTRRFVRCRICGCTTHVYPVSQKPEANVEVNVRLFEPGALGYFRIRLFDGAKTWKYIEDVSEPLAPPHLER